MAKPRNRRDRSLWRAIGTEKRGGPAWRRWLRERPTPVRRLAAIALVLGTAALNVALWRRADWALYPALRMSIAVMSFLLVAALLIRAALPAPGERPGGGRRDRHALLFTAFVLPVGLAALPPARAAPPPLDLWRSVAGCLLWGALMGLPVLGAVVAMDRARRPSRAALVACVALGSVAGNLALQLNCPVVDPAHLLFGHALLPALFAAVLLPWLARS